MIDRTKPPAHSDPNRDIWELAFQISSMQALLQGFELELQYKYEQQMNTLESLKKLSDFLMLMVNHIYDKRIGENSAPEGRQAAPGCFYFSSAPNWASLLRWAAGSRR